MTSALGPRGSTRKWRELRLLILARDNRVCWICGKGGADSVDHVTPRNLGGTDQPWNLRAAHLHCNDSRGMTAPASPAPSRQW